MNPEFLVQLATIKDNLYPYADEFKGIWRIIHAIEALLEQYEYPVNSSL